MKFINNNYNTGLLILRVSLGFLMLLHGIAKVINGIDGLKNRFAELGIEFFAYGVYIGEVIAPLLIIIGFRTKIASLLVAFTMLIAVVVAHPDGVFSLNKHGAWAIELNGLYFFGTLALFFTGGGKYSLSTKNKWD